jgi:large repetitive protein
MNLKHLVRSVVVVVAVSLGAAGQVRADSVVQAQPQRSGTVLATATAPRSPTAKSGNNALKLAWLAPSSNGGAKINRYRVQRATGAKGPWKTIAKPSVRRYRAGGLKNGVRYYFRIAAHNAAGYGASSTVVSAVPYTVPTAPKSLTAKSGDANVTLTWLPSSTGGAPINKYAVQWSPTGTSGWKTYAQPSTTTYTTSVFNCCQKYFLRIRAHNAAGWSPASSVVGYLPAAPSAPQTLSATAGNQSVDLLWYAPSSNGGASVGYYEVQWAPSAGGPWTTDALEPSTQRSVHGLTNGTQYFFRVRAHNFVGYGPYGSATATPSSAPSAPLSPSASAVGTKINLAWSPPTYDGGSPIQQYNIYTSFSFNGPFTYIGSTVGPTTTYVVNNPVPGKTYLFMIKAQNQFGEGPPSSLSAATVAVTVPGKVTVCDVTYLGGWADQMRLTWDPPISDGGAPILFYRVDVRVTSDPSVYTTTYVWSPSTTVDVDRVDDKYNDILITPYNNIGAGQNCSISLA